MSDISGDALGFLETEGLIAAIEASDAMVKAANVTLRAARAFGGGRVCVMVRGDLASCQAAIEAGKAMATAFGGFLQATVLARPDPDSEALWAKHMPAMEQRKKARAARRRSGSAKAVAEEAGQKAKTAAVKPAAAKSAAAKATKTKTKAKTTKS